MQEQEKPTSNENMVNRKAVSRGLPVTPIIPQNTPQAPYNVEAPNVMTARDMWNDGLASGVYNRVSEIPSASVYQGSRYDATLPGSDFEELHAQQQTAGEQWRHAALKMVGTAGTTFISGTAGLVWGIGDALINTKLSNVIDNDITRAMDESMKHMEDMYPNFYTHKENDADWYSSDNIMTANFWSDKVLKNLGFSVGALYGGVAWGSLFKSMKITNGLVRAGQGMEAAAATEAAIAQAPKLSKYTAFQEALKKVAAKGVVAPVGAVLRNSDRLLVSIMATSGEATIEALQGIDAFKEGAIDTFRLEHGRMPNADEMDEINGMADRVGLYVWGMNGLVLTATNYIMLPKILGSSRKADKAMINSIVRDTEKNVWKAAAKPGIKGTLLGLPKHAGRLLLAPIEAVEEGMQFAVQEGVDDYFQRAYENRDDAVGLISTLNETSQNVFTHGLDKTFNTKEGMESMLIGALSGGLQQSGIVGSYRKKDGSKGFGIGKSGNIAEYGWTGQGGFRAKNTATAVTALNKFTAEQALKDGVDYMARGIGSQALRQEAISNDDKVAEKDAEADFAISYLIPRIKYGKLDSVIEELTNYKTQAMNEKGFEELKQAGIVNSKEDPATFIARIDNLLKMSAEMDSMYTTINNRYENKRDDQGNIMYTAEVIDKMVYVATKIEDYDTRIKELAAELSSTGVELSSIPETIGQDGIVDEVLLAGLVASVNVKVTEEEDFKENIIDFAELIMRRKAMADSYQKIKESPENYRAKSERPLNIDDNGNVIPEKKVDGLDTESTISTGIAYLVSAPLQEDELGNIKEGPNMMVIIEENEDGTFLIKDNQGERNVTKEYLEGLELVKASEVAKNEKANFFVKNWNVPFSLNFGKKKGGRGKVDGRLNYDPANGILTFNYKKKGKMHRLEVTSDQFITNKEKNQRGAMIIPLQELSTEQKQALELFTSKKDARQLVKYQQRLDVLGNLMKDLNAREQQSMRLIESTQEKIQRSQKELKGIQLKIKAKDLGNKVGFKFATGELLKTATRMSNAIEKLGKEQIKLEEDLNQTEVTIAYVQTLIDTVEDFSSDITDYKKLLTKEQKNLKKLRDQTIEQSITTGEAMEAASDALATAKKLLKSFVEQLGTLYPGVPTDGIFNDDLETTQNYLEDIAAFPEKDGTKELLANMAGQEAVIKPSIAKLDILEKELDVLDKKIEDLSRGVVAKNEVLDAFDVEQKKWEEKKVQEEVLKEEGKLADEIVGTMRVTTQTTETNEGWEAESKKAKRNVILGTVSPDLDGETTLPYAERVQRFANKFDELLDQGKKFKARIVTYKTEGKVIAGLTKYLAQGKDKINPKNTIVYVITNEEGVPVDLDGEPIQEGKGIETGIFQVFPSPSLVQEYPSGFATMFRASEMESKDEYTTRYRAWVQAILKDNTMQPLEDFEPSFGFLDPAGHTDQAGNFIPEPGKRSSGMDAGLITNNELEERLVLEVPTTNDRITNGFVSFRNALGRVALIVSRGAVRLYNKKFSEAEANTIYKAIYFAAKFAQEDKSTKKDRSAEIYEWLYSVVYWGTPQNKQTGEAKAPGKNNIWFEKEKKTNKMNLFIGGNAVSFPFTPVGIEENIDAIKSLIMGMYNNTQVALIDSNKGSEYLAPYKEITDFDENGVPTKRTWPNYQTYLLSNRLPNSEGELSEKERPTEDIPLTTNVRKLEGQEDFNKKGIYFVRNINSDTLAKPEVAKEEVVPPPAGKKTEEEEIERRRTASLNEDPKKVKGPDRASYLRKQLPGSGLFEGTESGQWVASYTNLGSILASDGIFVGDTKQEVIDKINAHYDSLGKVTEEKTPIRILDGKTQNKGTSAFGSYVYTLAKDQAIEVIKAMGGIKIFGDMVKLQELTLKLIKDGIYTVNLPKDTIGRLKADGKDEGNMYMSILNDLSPLLTESMVAEEAAPIPPPVGAGGKPKVKAQDELDFGKNGVINFIMDTRKVKDAIMVDRDILTNPEKRTAFIAKLFNDKTIVATGDKKVRAFLKTEYPTLTEQEIDFKIVNTIIQVREVALKEEIEDENPTDNTDIEWEDDDSVPFRMKAEEENERYQTENWDKLTAWMKENFPQLPLYRVQTLIQATNGRQGWGMMRDAAIYVYKNAEAGTAYHEVFEAVWKMMATIEEKNDIIKEFRTRRGTFKEHDTGRIIAYKEASDLEMKEELAEEFRRFILYKTPAPKAGRNFIQRFFDYMIDAFNTFFDGKKGIDNTQKLFDQIGNGYYKDYLAHAPALALANVGVQDIQSAVGNAETDFRLAGIAPIQEQEILQHMTYLVYQRAMEKDEDLFVVGKTLDITIYDDLLDHIVGNDSRRLRGIIRKKQASFTAAATVGPLDVNFVTKKVAEFDVLRATVRANWPAIVEKHQLMMRAYDITFDEQDDIIINDANNDGKGDHHDGNKLDTYRKANAAIKMLFATLPDTYMVGAKHDIRPSSIGGVTFIESDRVFITLMNVLHSSVSPEQMLQKLKKLARNDMNYRTIYRRLTGVSYMKGEVVYKGLPKSKLKLITGFWKTLKKQNPDVLSIFLLANGESIVGDTIISNSASQAKYEMEQSIINKITNRETNFFEYNSIDKVYNPTDKLGEVKFTKDLKSYTDFLDLLGIELNPEDIAELDARKQKTFRKSVEGLRKSMTEMKDVMYVTPKTLKSANRLLRLGSIKSIIDHDLYDSTFFSIGGERTQTFIGPNAISTLFDVVNSADTIDGIAGTQFDYLLNDVFTRGKGSVVMNKLFNLKTGKRREGTEGILMANYTEGLVDSENGKKVEVSRLTYSERLLLEGNLNNDGVYLNLVPGDAGLEHGVRMYHDDNPFVSMAGIRDKDYMTIFKNYFIAEYLLSKEDRIVAKRRVKTDLRFFKGILEDPSIEGETKVAISKRNALHNRLVANIKGLSAEDLYDANQKEIEHAVERFIRGEAQDTYELYTRYKIITRAGEGKKATFRTKLNMGSEIMDATTMSNHMKRMAVNYIIANIEYHKIYYSDPYQYSDELKRIKNFTSPRQAIVHSSPKINAALNEAWNEDLTKDDIGYANFTRDHFRTVTLADVISRHDLPDYIPYEETDGGGVIAFSAYKVFRVRASDWSDSNERQYRFDIEYQQRIEAGQSKEDMKEFLATNPNDKSTYTPLKPIVSGNKANGRDYNDIVLDKYALVPLSFRILHEINPTSNGLKLLSQMVEEEVDYGVYSSGRKVGAEGEEVLFHMYDPKTGAFNEGRFQSIEERDGLANKTRSVNLPQSIINIPFSILSLQTEVPSKEKAVVTQGSQVTKLVTMDFMEFGVPIDYLPGKDIDDRFSAWTKIKSNALREEASPIYREIVYNQKLLETRIEAGFDTLLRQLGIRLVDDNYVLVDRARLVATLEEELFKQDVNDNLIEALAAFKKDEIVLEATTSYHQIRNILYSIANSNVVRPKISGGMKVQVPVTLLESQRDILVSNVDGKEYLHSNELEFYSAERDVDGKITKVNVAEIMVARWFKSPLSDEELLDLWYKKDETTGERLAELTPEGEKALKGVGFRTPTQKQNSIEVFVIKKFLPEAFGDAVVVPSAIVMKTGSDFDIDKLSLYLKNMAKSFMGKLTTVPFLTAENSTIKERYTAWVKEKSSKDTKDYVRYLSKAYVADIKNAFAEDRAAIEENYQYERAALSINSSLGRALERDERVEVKSAQDKEMKDLFRLGSAVFAHLTKDMKQKFWDLGTEMASKDLHGAIELESYWALSEKLQEGKMSPADRAALVSMSKLYKQELAVLGYNQKLIDAIDNVINKIKSSTDTLVGILGKETSKEYQRLKQEQEEDKAEQEHIWALEEALLEELPSLETFQTWDITKQNTMKALENEYIESLENLVSHPENFDNLVKPNSAEQMKILTNKLNKKLDIKPIDYSSAGFMLSRRKMSGLRRDFMGGRQAIGISAVAQTNHAQNQRAPIFMDARRLIGNEISKEDKFWLDGGLIKFPKFNFTTIDGQKMARLGGRKNPNKQYISDLVGMFIDGYVDIAHGPWIMQLGATPTTAGTWLYLVKIGVPIEDIVNFMNQPIIREYLETLETSGKSWVFNRRAYKDMIGSWRGPKIDVDVIPSMTTMGAMIGKEKSEMKPEQIAQQRFMLKEFLKVSKMAEHLFLVTQGTNMDTATFNDSMLVFKKQEQLKEARKTMVSSADKILETSFIGPLNGFMQKVTEAFSPILITDLPTASQILEDVMRPYIRKSDREFIRISQRATADLFDFAVQTNQVAGEKITSIMLGDTDIDSAAREIKNWRDSILGNKSLLIPANPTHPLFHNVIVNSIVFLPGGKEGKPDNIQIKAKDNKQHDLNLIINSFDEIRGFLHGQNNIALYKRMVKLAMFQSGLTNSKISFTTLLPLVEFQAEYNYTLSNLENIPGLDMFSKMHVFQRNQWADKEIVPVFPLDDERRMTENVSSKLREAMSAKEIPEVVFISEGNFKGERSDVIVYTWSQPISETVRKNRIETGNTDHLHKVLMRKVYQDTAREIPLIQKYVTKKGTTYRGYVFVAINAWGDSFRAQEFYTMSAVNDNGTPLANVPGTVFDNGFDKIVRENNNEGQQNVSPEVSDQDMMKAYLEGAADKQRVALTNINNANTVIQQAINSQKSTVGFNVDSVTYDREKGRVKIGNSTFPESMVTIPMLMGRGATFEQASLVLKDKIC